MTHTCAQCRKEIPGRIVTVHIEDECVHTTHFLCFECYGEMVKRSQWREIDTAPHETDVLVYQADDPDGPIFIANDLFGWSVSNNEGFFGHWLKPTHWMPLPAPPEKG